MIETFLIDRNKVKISVHKTVLSNGEYYVNEPFEIDASYLKSIKLNKSMFDSEDIEIGHVVLSECTIEIYDKDYYYTREDFLNTHIKIHTQEDLKFNDYYVYDAEVRYPIVTLHCYDALQSLNIPVSNNDLRAFYSINTNDDKLFNKLKYYDGCLGYKADKISHSGTQYTINNARVKPIVYLYELSKLLMYVLQTRLSNITLYDIFESFDLDFVDDKNIKISENTRIQSIGGQSGLFGLGTKYDYLYEISSVVPPCVLTSNYITSSNTPCANWTFDINKNKVTTYLDLLTWFCQMTGTYCQMIANNIIFFTFDLHEGYNIIDGSYFTTGYRDVFNAGLFDNYIHDDYIDAQATTGRELITLDDGTRLIIALRGMESDMPHAKINYSVSTDKSDIEVGKNFEIILGENNRYNHTVDVNSYCITVDLNDNKLVQSKSAYISSSSGKISVNFNIDWIKQLSFIIQTFYHKNIKNFSVDTQHMRRRFESTLYGSDISSDISLPDLKYGNAFYLGECIKFTDVKNMLYYGYITNIEWDLSGTTTISCGLTNKN